jgi:hypothetical protein
MAFLEKPTEPEDEIASTSDEIDMSFMKNDEDEDNKNSSSNNKS